MNLVRWIGRIDERPDGAVTEAKVIERNMLAIAETLPAWDWMKTVRGFGPMNFTILIAEAGDLSKYANPAKLWKRMGLAVFNGRSQRKVTDAVEAIEQGYCPRRRSVAFNLGETLVKCNKGVYRQLYIERKAYEMSHTPTMSKMHAQKRAKRYMEKRTILHLWRAWRDQNNVQ